MYHLAFIHSSVDGTFYSGGYWDLERLRRRKKETHLLDYLWSLWPVRTENMIAELNLSIHLGSPPSTSAPSPAWHLPTFPVWLRSSSLLLNSQSRKLLYQTTALPAFLLWPHFLLWFVQVVLFWYPETMKASSEQTCWVEESGTKITPTPSITKSSLVKLKMYPIHFLYHPQNLSSWDLSF